MQRRVIVLILCGAVLSACTGIPSMPSFSVPSFNMPSFSVPGFNSPGTPVRVESIPPGAEASIGNGPSCKAPCTLAAPSGGGSFNVGFALKGYEPQSVPVRVAISQSSSSWDSADAGVNTSVSATVIEPDPVVAELSPVPAAPTNKKMPPSPKAKKPPPKQPTAAAAPSPPSSSPPAPAMPTPQPGFGPAPQPNVFR
jgi:hypothetical protein